MKKKKAKKTASRFDWQWVWWGTAFVLFIAVVLLGFWSLGVATKKPAEPPVLVGRPSQVTGQVVKLYYYNEQAARRLGQDGEGNPAALLPVERVIPETKAPLKATIRLLIAGELTAEEKAAGFTTEFPHPAFKLIRADLDRGVLTLVFTDVPGFTTGGALRVELLAAQIEKTAKQFSGVKQVRFLPESLFQP
ncbi:MAG: GerMN domain-containing protein [Candidatus Margulisiibacteriota bacterium]